MPPRRLLLLACALLSSGCLWPVREKTDGTVADLATRTLDPQPAPVMPSALGGAPRRGPGAAAVAALAPADVRTTALMQGELSDDRSPPLPPSVPGSEAPLITLPRDRAERERVVRRLYPPLPPLPEAPRPLPGPGGKPYTLADLQRLATENSPALRQAAADVEAAKGSLLQARTYANPSVGFENDPNNNNTGAGAIGVYVDQVVRTMGKQKLLSAAAERDLRNAELALKRARIDLATSVRSAYYGFLVAQETALVMRSLAEFTDEVYRVQAKITVAGGFSATHEPAPLRAQAYAIRLAYKQAIASYVYAWKQLVAAVGKHQLPLTEVAGRVDRFIPRYQYDTVLDHVLSQHTDVLTAQNGIDKARYNLKYAQVTPYPDIEVRYTVQKDIALQPFGWYHTLQFGGPLPIWDRNKGNIIAAQAALERALEQPHTAEVTLTGNLATAFTAYKTNLDALIYYRGHVLPDFVRYYRGIAARRGADPAAAFGDLVTAQQLLVTNVTTYLTTLGSFWTGVVQVAALLQTEDLFQLGKPEELPDLPDLKALPRWACAHGTTGAGPAVVPGPCPAVPTEVVPATPLPQPAVLPLDVRPVREVPGR